MSPLIATTPATLSDQLRGFMKIERLTLNHIEDIARLHIETEYQTYVDTVPEMLSNVSDLEGRKLIWSSSIMHNMSTAFMMYLDVYHAPIGFVSGKLSKDLEEQSADLLCLYVTKKFQNLGYGKILFSKFVQSAVESGFSGMRSSAPSAVHTGREFFASVGAREEGFYNRNVNNFNVQYIKFTWKNLNALLKFLNSTVRQQ